MKLLLASTDLRAIKPLLAVARVNHVPKTRTRADSIARLLAPLASTPSFMFKINRSDRSVDDHRLDVVEVALSDPNGARGSIAVPDWVTTIVQAAFPDIQTSIRYFGWLPLLLLSFPLLSRVRPGEASTKQQLFGGVAATFSILWLLALIWTWLASLTLPRLHAIYLGAEAKFPFLSVFRGFFNDAYAAVDSVFAPATENMLLAILIVGVIVYTSSSRLSRPAGLIWGIALVILLLTANSRTIGRILSEPLLLLSALGFSIGARPLFGGSSSVFALFDRSTDRSLKVKNAIKIQYDFDLPIRLCFIWLIFTLFWYPVNVSSEVQIAFFSAAIGGLLAIVGFAALVFTFSYEQIRTARLRQVLARSTTDFQAAALPVIIASIFGLLITSGDLQFSHAGTDAWQATRIGIGLCAFSGLLISTHLILRTFREVTLGLAKLRSGETSANIFFEESLVDPRKSSTSGGDDGLLELTHILEDAGCSITPVIGIDPGALLSTKRAVIVIPKSNAEVPRSSFENIKQLVGNGAILWIMTDESDWKNKQELLSHFGFPSPTLEPNGEVRAIVCLKPGMRFGRISGSMSTKMTFKVERPLLPIIAFAESEVNKQSGLGSPMVAMGFDYGWIVVSTSLAPFINSHFRKSNDNRLVSDILDSFSELFPLGHQNVATRMHARFSRASSPPKSDGGQDSLLGASTTGNERPREKPGYDITELAEPLLPFDNSDGELLTPEEFEVFASRLDRFGTDVGMLSRATGRQYSLPFYQNARLIEFRDEAWRPVGARRFFLQVGSDICSLEGRSQPIHEVNTLHPVALNDRNVLEYCAFFCFFVHGDAGPFFILDRLDSAFIPAGMDRERILTAFRTPTLVSGDGGSGWLISAAVYYSNAIFHADFFVHPNGRVDMRNDQPFLTDLPHSMVAPLQVSSSSLH